jgi:hypothetical protein
MDKDCHNQEKTEMAKKQPVSYRVALKPNKQNPVSVVVTVTAGAMGVNARGDLQFFSGQSAYGECVAAFASGSWLSAEAMVELQA